METKMLIMHTKDGFYPIEASGKKSLKAEAKDHGELNPHVIRIEDFDRNVLWSRQ